MAKEKQLPEPEHNLPFIDCHCHLPWELPKDSVLSSPKAQLEEFFAQGGEFLISSSIDWKTLEEVKGFTQPHKKTGFTCGWAPQHVTFTNPNKYSDEKSKWIDYVKNNTEDFLAIGEIGLDFHHAKTFQERERQIQEFRWVLEQTKDLDKPYVIHARNASQSDQDKKYPTHPYNFPDAANICILTLLERMEIKPSCVMWHCFSGPKEYGVRLAQQGFFLSVPSSAFGFNRWRRNTALAPIDNLLTETDAPYQHPNKWGPVNKPANARYSIAAIAFAHEMSQQVVAQQLVANAKSFFRLK